LRERENDSKEEKTGREEDHGSRTSTAAD